MPRLTTRVPSYRRHKATGQAVVTLDGKSHYLGRYGSRVSQVRYWMEIREWYEKEVKQGRRQVLQGEQICNRIYSYWKELLHKSREKREVRTPPFGIQAGELYLKASDPQLRRALSQVVDGLEHSYRVYRYGRYWQPGRLIEEKEGLIWPGLQDLLRSWLDCPSGDLPGTLRAWWMSPDIGSIFDERRRRGLARAVRRLSGQARCPGTVAYHRRIKETLRALRTLHGMTELKDFDTRETEGVLEAMRHWGMMREYAQYERRAVILRALGLPCPRTSQGRARAIPGVHNYLK
jgi:hypothetical protein